MFLPNLAVEKAKPDCELFLRKEPFSNKKSATLRSFAPMDLDALMARLSAAERPTPTEVDQIIALASLLFASEPNTLILSAPITVCGDTHGQLFDVLHLFNISQFPPTCRYLFLGDYVDRGYYSVELLCLLLCYKLKYPSDFFLIRGNHETRNANREYGLYAEIQTKYLSLELYHTINNLFDLLPFTAIVDDRLFCVHGGLDPKLSYVSKLTNIDRCVEPELGSLMGGLLWSDPNENVSDWMRSERRSGYHFNSFHAKSFLEQNQLKMIVRSHEMVDGYRVMLNGQLTVVWSAPNYVYVCKNRAGVLQVHENGEDSHLVYNAMPAEQRKRPEPTTMITYFT
jgi:diadenosine tetraphosphatase ApaH/serine/threonine PP2A family protein phosphatase